VFGVSLGFGDLISVELHARWTPDLTILSPPAQCVKSGTVGGGVEFHLKALYSPPVTQFVCDKMVIEEITQDHPPQTIVRTSFNNVSSLGCCSSPPPPGTTQALFCTIPFETYQFHNADYRVTAYYHYIIMRPPPQQPQRVDGNISITVTFQNLTVSSEPKILKWDPDNPSNCDTTISYTLSAAQKKNCQVIIDIYSTEGTIVYETTLTQLCPGSYTFTWDGSANQTSYPSNNIAPAGLYTFDIKVNGKTPDGLVLNDDKDRMRSEIITVSQTSLDIEDDKYKFGYYFQSSDGSLPSKAEVMVYGPAIDNFKRYLGPKEGGTNLGWNYVYFPIDTIEVGGEHSFVVVSGWDSDVNNKAHNHKPFRERNKNPKLATAALFYADYKWEKIGYYPNGNPIWRQVPDEATAEANSRNLKYAKEELLKGAFKKPPDKDEKIVWTFFGKGWADKETGEKYNMIEIAAGGAVIAALKNVNIFDFEGHGDGYSIEFKQTETDKEYVIDRLAINNNTLVILREKRNKINQTQYTTEPIPLPGSISFSNLHLVVVATCRLSSVLGFPILDAIIKKGAKFAIGIGGNCPYDLTTGEYYPGFRLLYPFSVEEWHKVFWKIATKMDNTASGDKDDPKWKKMGQAAQKAFEKANREIINKYKRNDLTITLTIKTPNNDPQEDDYLGNINL
jgi:hypothetical protein